MVATTRTGVSYMSLQTFVLSEQTASLPLGPLFEQAASGGVEVRNGEGKVVAYVLPAGDEETWQYAEARVYFEKHRAEFEAARARRKGITTAELLAKAEAITNHVGAP
jgi:hypothetical protein